MTTITRRAALGAIASLPAIGAATEAFPSTGSTAPETINDPLLDAIRAYRAGMDDYNVNAPDDSDEADAYAEISYAPSLEVLAEWEQPAKTYRGALEALRLVAEENVVSQASDINGPLLAAALAYFEAQS
ncbi:hypothetical protein ACFX5Q_07450 [Mesorhizobium sp. IMUNJ 23033]|uniref:hypothetical protein n=1 Tax=Mesorhizobium sp. IMUNJ 23033 TaxID=3378039 RepID=UPI00384EB8B7